MNCFTPVKKYIYIHNLKKTFDQRVAPARNVPTKPRFRSVPDVMVLNSQPLSGLLIKYQRLPRDFFWNHFSPMLVCRIGKFVKYLVASSNTIVRNVIHLPLIEVEVFLLLFR